MEQQHLPPPSRPYSCDRKVRNKTPLIPLLYFTTPFSSSSSLVLHARSPLLSLPCSPRLVSKCAVRIKGQEISAPQLLEILGSTAHFFFGFPLYLFFGSRASIKRRRKRVSPPLLTKSLEGKGRRDPAKDRGNKERKSPRTHQTH